MYDLKRDPFEMTNLAHAAHCTAPSDIERERLHQRLTEGMREKGTTPDEIRWPEVDDFPAAGAARSERTPEELAEDEDEGGQEQV